MKKLQVIAGNCVLENLKTSLDTSSFLKEMSQKYNFDLIYKSSYKKDNRSSTDYFSTLGEEKSTEIFSELKSKNFKIITDVHNLYELDLKLFDFIDIIQIPAYLCMQTELTTKAAKKGKSINIKKRLMIINGNFTTENKKFFVIKYKLNKLRLFINELKTIDLPLSTLSGFLLATTYIFFVLFKETKSNELLKKKYKPHKHK